MESEEERQEKLNNPNPMKIVVVRHRTVKEEELRENSKCLNLESGVEHLEKLKDPNQMKTAVAKHPMVKEEK